MYYICVYIYIYIYILHDPACPLPPPGRGAGRASDSASGRPSLVRGRPTSTDLSGEGIGMPQDLQEDLCWLLFCCVLCYLCVFLFIVFWI